MITKIFVKFTNNYLYAKETIDIGLENKFL